MEAKNKTRICWCTFLNTYHNVFASANALRKDNLYYTNVPVLLVNAISLHSTIRTFLLRILHERFSCVDGVNYIFSGRCRNLRSTNLAKFAEVVEKVLVCLAATTNVIN